MSIEKMTKAKCRELYEQMETAVSAFEDALTTLRSRNGYAGTGRDHHFECLNCDLFLLDAGEALEQTVED
jgi:hypothetical protein